MILDDNENESASTSSSFKWDAAIIGILKRAPDHQLSVKKLRKKVGFAFLLDCVKKNVFINLQLQVENLL
jgi:hypothetical protein